MPQVAHRRPESAPEEIIERWRRWGVGGRVLDLIRRRQFRVTESVKNARELAAAAQQGRTWCVLCGVKGAGKTVASAVWLDELRGSPGARLHETSEGLAALNSKLGETEKHLQYVIQAAAVVIDDLGFEDAEDVEGKRQLHRHVARVLRRRYDRGAPTLLTTNLSVDELLVYFGQTDDGRMVDRWYEVGEPRSCLEVVRPRNH